ncbi:type VI secretion system (T6SS) effector Tae4 (amidase) [Paraburkholderia sp. BL23I1N1]|uniref:T6SS effector amidase Tae4 family protein n=1 Tax=Paraburkholderia sp. BL23I1N1 TaxID=1938802 RepID=UPI000E715B8C|nr:T6SS effector amidase Tae4 family protein [Paraburkholderia sp. BL23I1N1]RKE34465.1 type VI secretion system (T6SS) effector Tae4 (amidase) [Paraburkholderia sp. BL23I1N1]
MPNKPAVVRTNSTPGSVKVVEPKVVIFSEFWRAYPQSEPCINPSTGKPAFEDECAIRLGTCFANVGITNRSFKGQKCWFHGHPPCHMLRAKEIAEWLNRRPFAGCPVAETVTGRDWQTCAKGRTGIIFFGSYWRRSLKERNPSGDHIDLWNGERLTPSTETTLRFDIGIPKLWNPLSVIGVGPENLFSNLADAKQISFWEIA